MMTTYDKDVPSQHWFMTYPRWVMSYCASARGAGTAEMVREADETAQPLASAVIKVGWPKTTLFLPQSQSKFVDAFGSTYEESFQGERTVCKYRKAKS